MSASGPLFALEANAFLTDGQSHGLPDGAGGAQAAMLRDFRADWLSGVDHAPPWRLLRKGLGFAVAPMKAPDGLTTHFLSGEAVAGQNGLSITLDANTRAGASLPPILQALGEMTLDLATAFDSRWVIWHPARMAYPRAFLFEQMEQWRVGGLIPLLAFVAFAQDAGGAEVTRGLSFFGLPEIRFTARPAMARGDAVRRMIRMAYAMLADAQSGEVRDGPSNWDGDYDGLLSGERMRVQRRGDMLNLTSTIQD